ncbi:MAG TPA: hypothetical protein DIC60_09860 [Lachnospiraceae bacterium]|nr:hypothetical protein [Lachnospiraceae bacterium]
MSKKYEETAVIAFNNTNARLQLTQNSLTVLFQELAIHHSDSLGYTLHYLSEEQKGWAITNWHILIDRFPKYGEEVTMQTWSPSCRRMQAERSFRMIDSNGNIIARASSRWIYMDFKRRRPTTISKSMEEDYYSGLESIIKKENYKLPKRDEENLVLEVGLSVRRSETDSNGHTNNTQYITWAMDLVPDYIYDGYHSYDIGVVYRRECYRNSEIIAKTYVKDIAEEKEVITCFLDANDNSIIFCEVATLWGRKD